ncbi:MAG: dephospho-CoA kinase [Solirubrobacterales bacterium]
MAAAVRTVGLTGGIGAGKSEVLTAFGDAGAETLSSDAVVHELLGTGEVRDLLAERWGDQVLSDGELDRGAIAGIVFDDDDELAFLESVLHPRVRERIMAFRDALDGTDAHAAVVEVPLLFENDLGGLFDTTVCVTAPESLRRQRLAERDGQVALAAREARQLTQEQKAARAEHVLVNDGSPQQLATAASDLLARIVAERHL